MYRKHDKNRKMSGKGNDKKGLNIPIFDLFFYDRNSDSDRFGFRLEIS